MRRQIVKRVLYAWAESGSVGTREEVEVVGLVVVVEEVEVVVVVEGISR